MTPAEKSRLLLAFLLGFLAQGFLFYVSGL